MQRALTDPSSRLFRACGRQELRAALTLVDVKNPPHIDAAASRSCGPLEESCALRKVALAGGCNVADSVPRFNDGDKLHPNDAGYKAMAEAIDLTVFTAKK